MGVKEENSIALALDDDLNREYRNPDKLSEFLYSKITNKTETFYILLDEIQFAISDKELKGKEPIRIYGILNGLLRLDNVDIYVTGSNSKFLSSDIMTNSEVVGMKFAYSHFLLRSFIHQINSLINMKLGMSIVNMVDYQCY